MIVFGPIVSGEDAVKGLMNVKKPLFTYYGMLFDMDGRSKINSMWMKNTFIPLDVIFLDEDMNIVGYKENNIPHSLKQIKINTPSRYVLEMNGGTVRNFSLKKGDKICFINYKWIIIIILILFSIIFYFKYL